MSISWGMALVSLINKTFILCALLLFSFLLPVFRLLFLKILFMGPVVFSLVCVALLSLLFGHSLAVFSQILRPALLSFLCHFFSLSVNVVNVVYDTYNMSFIYIVSLIYNLNNFLCFFNSLGIILFHIIFSFFQLAPFCFSSRPLSFQFALFYGFSY